MDRIGLTGPHKSGKTTLAKAIAERWDLKYVDMNLSSVLKKFETSANTGIPFMERLKIQNEMIGHIMTVLDGHDRNYITDRTFLDIAAYTLSYMPHDITDDESDCVRMIIDQCYRFQPGYFDCVAILDNSFKLPRKPDYDYAKANYNWAWNFQISTIIKGLTMSTANRCHVSYIADDNKTLAQRIQRMDVIITDVRSQAKRRMQ